MSYSDFESQTGPPNTVLATPGAARGTEPAQEPPSTLGAGTSLQEILITFTSISANSTPGSKWWEHPTLLLKVGRGPTMGTSSGEGRACVPAKVCAIDQPFQQLAAN